MSRFDSMLEEPSDVTRAKALLNTFKLNPDYLSPDEQVLAQAVRRMEDATRDVMETLRESVAQMIEQMAESHYARDIRGDLARMNWLGIADTLRKTR